MELLQKRLTAHLVCAALLALSGFVSAEPRTVDARQLDVAGVKTGMDYNEALNAASEHLHAPKNQFKPEQFPNVNLVTGTKEPSWFTYDSKGTKLTVYFEGRIPVDKTRPLVVWLVRYEVPWSQENSTAMANAAVQKYGAASNAPNTLPMQWCGNPSANTGLGCPKDMGHAYLELTQTTLALTDPSWQQARINFQQAQKKTTPSF